MNNGDFIFGIIAIVLFIVFVGFVVSVIENFISGIIIFVDFVVSVIENFISGIIIIGLFIVFVVYVIMPIALVAAGTGVLLGSGHAVVNYFTAFYKNVKWE